MAGWGERKKCSIVCHVAKSGGVSPVRLVGNLFLAEFWPFGALWDALRLFGLLRAFFRYFDARLVLRIVSHLADSLIRILRRAPVTKNGF